MRVLEKMAWNIILHGWGLSNGNKGGCQRWFCFLIEILSPILLMSRKVKKFRNPFVESNCRHVYLLHRQENVNRVTMKSKITKKNFDDEVDCK